MLSGTIRVKFQKTGDLKFISHLDLMRFFTRALIRAKIPLVYTEGFNPHPKLTFGLPLSVGVESVCEWMEFRLAGEMTCEEIRERLNRCLPNELSVSEVYNAEGKEKLSSIAWAEYVFGFDCEIEPEKVLKAPIEVQKRTKSGEKTVDIAPMIRRYTYENGVLSAVLGADSRNYLNPELVAKLFGTENYTIRRTKCFLDDAEQVFS